MYGYKMYLGVGNRLWNGFQYHFRIFAKVLGSSIPKVPTLYFMYSITAQPYPSWHVDQTAVTRPRGEQKKPDTKLGSGSHPTTK